MLRLKPTVGRLLSHSPVAFPPEEMDVSGLAFLLRSRIAPCLFLMMAGWCHAQMADAERRVLAPPAGASTESASAVAFGSSFAIVGDPGADAVYAYTRSSTSSPFALDATLRRSGFRYGRFGIAVAIQSGRLYVGAPGVHQDAQGEEIPHGSVTVYRRDGAAWVLERVLQPGAGATPQQDGFGSRVAVAGRHLLVAASEERAIHAFDAQTGDAPLQRIDVAARVPGGGLWDEQSGLLSLVIDGDSAVIGLRFDEFAEFHALRWSGTSWAWEAELLRVEWPEWGFGTGAAFRGGHLVVPTADGSRHFERLSDSRWVERSGIGASTTGTPRPHLRAAFGDLGLYIAESDAVRLYRPSAGTWQRGPVVEPRPSSLPRGAVFAAALSASGNGVVVGSPGAAESAVVVGPPSAQASTSIDVSLPVGEPVIEGAATRLVVSLRSAESVVGATVDVFEGETRLCTAVMSVTASGTLGFCDATFRTVGRRSLDARFAGSPTLAPATRRVDLVVQPALRLVGYGRALEMAVGVPVTGRLGVYAPGATPPLRFTPRQLVAGVSIDAEGRISGTPTTPVTGARFPVVVTDSSAARHGVDFQWSVLVEIDVVSGRVPRTSLGLGMPAALEAGVSEALPYGLLGPSGMTPSFRSESPEICRLEAGAELRVDALRMGVCVIVADASGPGYATTTTTWRLPVSTRGRPLTFALPDRLVIDRPPGVGSVTTVLPVLANDLFDATGFDPMRRLTIVRPPTTGNAQVLQDGRISYSPRTPFTAIRDSFRYRLCATDGVTCSEATAWIVANPGVPVDASLEVEGQSGSVVVDFRSIPSGAPTVRRTGGLLAPSSVAWSIPASFGIDSPFDEGFAGASFVLRDVPANAGANADAWRVHVDASSAVERPDLAVFVGLDANRNGQPDIDEMACASVAAAARASCDMRIPRQAGQGAQSYWIMVQNRTAAALPVRVDVYAEEATPPAVSPVTVTGPTFSRSRDEAWPTRIGWDDTTLLVGDRRLAYLSFWRGDTFLGEAPLRIVRRAGRPSPLALRDGVGQPIALMPAERQARLFFDVPASAASVRIDLRDAEGVALRLSRAAVQSEHDPSDANDGAAAFTIPAAGATKSIELSTTRLTPGRWYVTPANESPRAVTPTLTVSTTAAASRVQPVPGHYYNPQRSGHGVFLDYARNDWVLIWYTYREDKSSTWYMTDVSPRGATSWTSPLYEFGWDGGRTVSTRVGWVSVNAISESAFAFTYHLHGRSGYERFDRLGGPGCLSTSPGAPPLDVSGLWFAPELPGYGWSVQVDAATRQSIIASYLYDHLGRPVWLWSQEPITASSLRIDQPTVRFDGPCPHCPYAPPSARSDRGTVSVELGTSSLQRMQLEHSGFVAGLGSIIEWQWSDRAMRRVVQLSEPSGCR